MREQVDLSLLSRPLHEGNPKVNAGGKRRGAFAAATLMGDVPPPAAKTRSRGAKRSMVYAGLYAYSTHFSDLVSLELKYEKVRHGSRRYRGSSMRGRSCMWWRRKRWDLPPMFQDFESGAK